MTVDAILVNGAVITAFVSGVIRNRYVQKGNLRPVYWLMLVMAAANTTLNTVIAYEKPAYAGLYLFNILIAHSVYAAIQGLRRLNNEQRGD